MWAKRRPLAPCIAAAVLVTSVSASSQSAIPALGIPSAFDAAQALTLPPKGGDATAGKALAQQRCAACHGLDGRAAGFPDHPRLAGQHEAFLYLQLVNYATGERKHPIMSVQVAGLTDKQLKDASAYFAKQPLTPMKSNAAPAELQLGAKLFNEGAKDRGVLACAWCHGTQGRGNAPVFARIGGQHPNYIVTMLQLFKDKSGFTNPYAYVMKAVATPLTPQEMRAIAEYASTLP